MESSPVAASVNAAKDLEGGETAAVGATLPHPGPLQRLGPHRTGTEHGQPPPDQEEQQDVPHRVLQVRRVDLRILSVVPSILGFYPDDLVIGQSSKTEALDLIRKDL